MLGRLFCHNFRLLSRRVVFLMILFTLMTFSLSAFAGGSSRAELYETEVSDAPLVVAMPGSFLFFDDNLVPLRGYSWKSSKETEFGKPFYVVDLDLDKKPEFVGAGKPTFVINGSGNTAWADTKGCDQLLVGDFAADEKLDLACIRGNTIKIVTYDNQMVWELNTGRRLDNCKTEDLNGDQKLEIECHIKGKKKYIRVDGTNGAIIANDSPESKVELSFESTIKPVTGGTLPDVEKAPKGEIIAVVTRDFNRDKKEATFALTDATIYVNNEGEKNYQLDAKKYKRVPVATLKAADVNQFESNEEAQKVAYSLSEPLSKCYASAVKKSPFAGSGQIVLRAEVDEKEKVSSVQKLYSSLADKKIDDCIFKVIKKTKFTKPVEGQKGKVNLTVLYEFKSK